MCVESQQIGVGFERFVKDVYKGLGCRSIEHSVIYSLKMKDSQKKNFQIDLTYVPRFGLRKRFVECKYTAADYYSDFKEVSYFISKLKILGIPPKRGDFVCNRPFSEDIFMLAKANGLYLIDESRLMGMWADGKKILGLIHKPGTKRVSLERLVMAYA